MRCGRQPAPLDSAPMKHTSHMIEVLENDNANRNLESCYMWKVADHVLRKLFASSVPANTPFST